MSDTLMKMNEECFARELLAVESAIESLIFASAKVDFALPNCAAT